MKRASGPYRDSEDVLRCSHGRKLHLACDKCQQEVRKRDREFDAFDIMLTVVGAILGVLATLYYYGFFN